MYLTVVILGLVAVLIVMSVVSHSRKKFVQGKLHTKGFDAIENIRLLAELAPQHRGLANAFLNGNESVRGNIDAVSKHVDEVIQKIDSSHGFLTSGTHMVVRWRDICDRWNSLKESVFKLTPEESFAKHTHIIRETLYLMRDVAEHAGITQCCDSTTEDLVVTLVLRIPDIVESVGQARGIGMGAVSKGNVITSARVKLCFLEKRISETLEAVLKSLGESQTVSSGLVEESHKATREFIDLINRNVLECEKITIAPAEYYDAGTATISINLKLFDTLCPLLLERARP